MTLWTLVERRWAGAALILSGLGLLSACGAPLASSSEPAATALPGATIGASSSRPTATAAPLATATPVAHTPSPTPTPEPRFHLTGLPAPDEASTYRRPIIVKVDNAPAARPQTGLQAADVVYEFVAEGGVTRFSAIYQSNDAPVVGPVRSARLPDLEIVPGYQAMFAHSSASEPVQSLIWKSGITDIDYLMYFQRAFWRSRRFVPHNLYTDVRKLRQVARANGWDVQVNVPAFAFDPTPPSGAEARVVDVLISQDYLASYQYDPDTRRYLRSMGGPTIDLATGQQIAVDNLIVQFATQTVTNIIEDQIGSRSIRMDLMGEGSARLFRDGVDQAVRWKHDRLDEPPSFVDALDRPVSLKPGVTWIALVPPGTAIDVAGSPQ